jgi:hypothetical protein
VCGLVVADADAVNQPVVPALGERGVNEFEVPRRRPVDVQQVDTVDTQPAETALDGRPYLSTVEVGPTPVDRPRVEHLCRQVDRRSVDSSGPDPVTDGLFVPVQFGGVDVTVAGLECAPDAAGTLLGVGVLPGSQSQSRDRRVWDGHAGIVVPWG